MISVDSFWSIVPVLIFCFFIFFFQAEDGIRDAQESRGLGDVYKRQALAVPTSSMKVGVNLPSLSRSPSLLQLSFKLSRVCLLYTSDAADDLLCVDLGGRRIIKKKKYKYTNIPTTDNQLTTITLYSCSHHMIIKPT